MSGAGDGGADPPKTNLPVPLRKEIEGLLEEAEVPAEKRESAVEKFGAIVLQAESYRGPLPHPKHVAQFEKILPGAAERIFSMAEREQAHHHACENNVIKAQSSYGTRGQYMGATLIVLPLVAAFYCAVTGLSWTIVGLFLAPPVITAAIAFVNHRIKLFNDDDDNDDSDDENS